MIEILHPQEDSERIELLRTSGFTTVDAWKESFGEYGSLQALDPTMERLAGGDLENHSRYVVYPWRNTVVRLPEDEVFHRLRTARNRFLITDEEQREWGAATIAVAGLSVGASLLHTCVLTGARRFRIADPDALGLTNLNRLSGSVCDIGVPKTTLARRRMLEIDPFLAVESFDSGVTEATLRSFLGCDGRSRADIILEEVDDLAMKVAIRRHARAAEIPLVMVTDDGDGVIVDVERYDLDPSYPEFHGLAGPVTSMSAAELADPANKVRIASAIVGADVSPRVNEALAEAGRTISSWPQLGSAATMAGAVGATIARQIICGEAIPSGRTRVQISAMLTG
ncbi:ThiF family adenylyltransferase [Gordonia alkanivorans]|uniref:ThiF family adenylyltransferase n=1 Tax=Gordonia alkanivorans TaxID=84096 RepID=UPI001F4D81C2|nr:ThiF family adenylyltransferase [Gordonia alkanivorans]